MGFSFSAILPSKDLFKPVDLKQVVDKAMAETARGVVSDLYYTTKNWKGQPDFYLVKEDNGNSVSFRLMTESKVWKWLDEGVRRHPIRASRYRPLFFQGHYGEGRYGRTYTSSTVPNRLGSRPAEYHGNTVLRFNNYVINHPGVRARNFSELILAKHGNVFQQHVDRYLRNQL